MRFIKPAPPHTNSDEIRKLIRSWIDECHNHHPRCMALQGERTSNRHLPTRLLRIEQEEGLLHVKLCDSAHINPAVLYTTLSHVWGTSVPLVLNCETIGKLVHGITVDSLPQTFRDAVDLTASLSLQYLWIDSLCILQDSASDWERECALMSGVYNGALINIAASTAVDSHGGLFTARDPLAITPCTVSVSSQTLGWQFQPCVVWARNNEKRHIADAPLNKRGWVLQEWLLAPRTVHFTPRKLFWECPQLLASEADPIGDFEHYVESALTRQWIVPPSRQEPVKVQSAECLKKWRNAVELYSSGKLTYESDKLVAVAGIANYLHSFSGSGHQILGGPLELRVDLQSTVVSSGTCFFK